MRLEIFCGYNFHQALPCCELLLRIDMILCFVGTLPFRLQNTPKSCPCNPIAVHQSKVEIPSRNQICNNFTRVLLSNFWENVQAYLVFNNIHSWTLRKESSCFFEEFGIVIRLFSSWSVFQVNNE